MAQLMAKHWVVSKGFEGVPKPGDLKLLEEPVSLDLKPGEIVTEALYLTVDPYMRLMVSGPDSTAVGETVYGEQVARVKLSRNPAYPEGSLVVASCGWRTLTRVANPDAPAWLFDTVVRKLPDFGWLSPSLALGCLGMPGLTAYFALLHKGQPQAGELVLVSSAAGTVGSVAGQIAKIKGCTVIGSAGSKAKCDWLREVGFDHVFNYKETSVDDALKQMAPGGIDLYFDNVGGEFSYIVLKNHMKERGRVICCGAIAEYNNTADSKEYSIYMPVISNELTVSGFDLRFYKKHTAEGLAQLLQWVQQGKLKYQETVTEGFDRMPEAFISLFQGGNTGKAVIKV